MLKRNILVFSTLFMLSLISFKHDVFAFDLKKYLRTTKKITRDNFFENFNFRTYLRTTPFTDFDKIDADKYTLVRYFRDGRIGNEFLYYLGQNFYEDYLYLDAVHSQLDIAEMYIDIEYRIVNGRKLAHHEAQVYQTVGYFLLSKIAVMIGEAIKNNDWDIEENERISILERLKKRRVYVTLNESRMVKLWKNLKKCAALEWEKCLYLADRAYSEAAEYLEFEKEAPNSNNTITTNAKLYTKGKYHPIGNGEHVVDIYKLEIDGNFVGHSIWMKRPLNGKPGVRAKYFSFQNDGNSVFHSYQNWVRKGKKNVVLATTGGFTNSNGLPEGVTSENGHIVNSLIAPERDGLVIFEKNGGLRVINLKKAKYKLPHIFHTDITNLRSSLKDYSTFRNWIVDNKISLFQTQLFAYERKLLINKQLSNAVSSLRERRLLVIVVDRTSKQIYNIIFDIKVSFKLYDISRHIFGIIEKRKWDVIAILNLDVGSYNILNVFDDNGRIIRDLTAPVPIQKATNLIVYTMN